MKTPGLRSKTYRQFVSALPCCVCDPTGVLHPWDYQDGVRRSDPDHLPVAGLKAVGIKSPDAACVPLCRSCHDIRARFFKRPWHVFGTQECLDKRIPLRFALWNPFETAWRLLWAFTAAGDAAGQDGPRALDSIAI